MEIMFIFSRRKFWLYWVRLFCLFSILLLSAFIVIIFFPPFLWFDILFFLKLLEVDKVCWSHDVRPFFLFFFFKHHFRIVVLNRVILAFPRGNLAISVDIFDCHDRNKLLLGFSGYMPRILLRILQCTGQTPGQTPCLKKKYYPTRNVNCTEVKRTQFRAFYKGWNVTFCYNSVKITF